MAVGDKKWFELPGPSGGCDIDCDIEGKVASHTCSLTVDIPDHPDEGPVVDMPTAKDVTEERIDGDGVFDIYMRAGMNQLMTQYDAGRIKGADFAAAYIAMVQLMMTEANKFVLGLVQAEILAAMLKYNALGALYDAALKESQALKAKAEVDLVCQQTAELKANGKVERGLKDAQKQAQIKTAELYARQIKGFDEKSRNDLIKNILDAWSVQGVEFPDTADGSHLVQLGQSKNNDKAFNKNINEILSLAGLTQF